MEAIITLIFSSFKRLTTVLTSPFRMMLINFQRLFNINIITAKLISPLSKKIKELSKLRPEKSSDYYSFGSVLVYKKLFATITMVACAAIFIYFMMFASPIPEQAVESEEVITQISYDYDDMDISEFTGVANIKSSDGKIVYTGDVNLGVCSGEGTLYDRDGNLLYEGSFENNKYQGMGTKYYPNDTIQYVGDFENNQFSGSGKEYDVYGNIVYEGSFKDDEYHGTGMLFSETSIIYEGAFANGNYHGAGTLYSPNGTISYSGDFYEGKPQGVGTMYNSAGKVIYTGSVYNGDINHKALINASLADLDTMFTETPKIYYSSNDTVFFYEQAGVVISTDAKMMVYEWEKPQDPSEIGQGEYYMPTGASHSSEFANLTLSSAVYTPKTYTLAPMLFAPATGSDDSSSSSSDDDEEDEDTSTTSGSVEIDEYIAALEKQAEANSAAFQEYMSAIIQMQEEQNDPQVPDFVDKSVTLYFEIDKNVWSSEAELDRSKVFVDKVTVISTANPRDMLPDVIAYDENFPPSVEDCVSINYIRKTDSAAFSNIAFVLDEQNKLFIELAKINYAERIIQESYIDGEYTYIFSYQLDDPSQSLYYSISN